MSIRFREDRKKWEAAIVVQGRRRRPLFATKKEALEAVKLSKHERFGLKEKEKEEAPKIPIGSAFREYFELESKPNKSPSSRSNDEWYFNLAHHFLTGERKLEFVDQILLQDLEALQRWLIPARSLREIKEDGSERVVRKEAWASSTANRAFHTYDHFFTKMCAWGKLEKNPAQYVKSLSERPTKRMPMTREIYEELSGHWQTPFWFADVLEFMYELGVRGSSIERFNWAMVNFKEHWLEVDTRKGAKAATKLIRLPMSDRMAALLIRVRNKWPGITGPVFRNDKGSPVRAAWISKLGGRLLRACGFEGVDLYGARHGLASDLINAGVQIELVRQLLGHSSVKTTQNYTKNTSMETLARALTLVRGDDPVPPDATKTAAATAVGGSD